MQLSVVLCTYNPKPAYLSRALHAIAEQLPEMGQQCELIIVDNNSVPPLLEWLDVKRYSGRIIREERQGLTAARAAGIRAAAGDVVLFVDDDNVLHPGFLKRVVAAFSDEKLGLLGCAVEPEYEVPPPNWHKHFEHQLAIRRYPPYLDVETTELPYTNYFPIGAGFSVRRTLALQFIEDAERSNLVIEGRKGNSLSAGEDLDLALYCLHAEHKLRVIGACKLTHIIPANRLTEAYTVELAVGSLKSSVALNVKWGSRMAIIPFPFANTHVAYLIVCAVIHGCMGIFFVKHRIKSRIFHSFSIAREL